MCVDFRNAKDKYDILLQKIEETSFVDAGNEYQFVDRMGNIPYTYYNLRKSRATTGEITYRFNSVSWSHLQENSGKLAMFYKMNVM